MKAELVKANLEERLKELKKALEEGRAGDGFLPMLEKLGRFHRYSPRNVMLILEQYPNATLVAGIRRWNELGRRVKRGEKGIAILAPKIQRRLEKDEDGTEKEVVEVEGFRTVYVFDIAQTEGKPLPLPGAYTQEQAEGREDIYARLRASCPLPVVEKPLGGGQYGYTDGGRVTVSSDLGVTERAETLIHEWAHVALGHLEGQEDRTTQELEAEAVAYAVGRHLGLPMQGSRDYILMWRGTVEGLEASLERIIKASQSILEALGTGGMGAEDDPLQSRPKGVPCGEESSLPPVAV